MANSDIPTLFYYTNVCSRKGWRSYWSSVLWETHVVPGCARRASRPFALRYTPSGYGMKLFTPKGLHLKAKGQRSHPGKQKMAQKKTNRPSDWQPLPSASARAVVFEQNLPTERAIEPPLPSIQQTVSVFSLLRSSIMQGGCQSRRKSSPAQFR
jgi:hypothetical protein